MFQMLGTNQYTLTNPNDKITITAFTMKNSVHKATTTFFNLIGLCHFSDSEDLKCYRLPIIELNICI